MRTVVLVPRRAGDPQRDRVWEWARTQWWPSVCRAIGDRVGGTVEVHEGHHDHGEFNRSAAVNTAWRAAHADPEPAEMVVIADADTIIGPQQAASAVEIAQATGKVTFGHARFAALSAAGTDRIIDGWRGDWEPFIEWTAARTASSFVALRTDLWHKVGWMDEGFVSWGHEDIALSLAAFTLGGGEHRVAGDAFHLWHEPAPGCGATEHPAYKRNQARCDRYIAASGDPVAMSLLLATLDRREPLRTDA